MGAWSVLRIGYWLLFATLVAALFVLQTRAATNVDVAWNIIAGQKVWAGLTYPDGINDINPPLIALLNVPPAALAQLLPIPLPVVFILYVYAFALFSLWLIYKVVPLPLEEGPGFTVGVFFLVVILLFLQPGIEFGEREHLICVMTLPYLCVVARRWLGHDASTGTAILCAAYAALALCLKPTFLALPALIFLVDVWRQKSLRPLWSAENLTFAAVVVLYLAVIFLLFPGYLTIAADGVYSYSGYRVEPRKTISLASRFALPGVFCFAIAILCGVGRTLKTVLCLAGLVMIVGTVTAVSQMKDWSYHFLPVRFAVGLICGAALMLALRRLRDRTWPALGALPLLLGAFIGLAEPIAANQAYAVFNSSASRMKQQPLYVAFHEKMRGAYVMNLSPAVGIDTQAIHVDAKWGSRYPSLLEWPYVYVNLPRLSALKPADAERVRRIDRALKAGLAADMEKFKPKLIFVELNPEVNGVEDVDILKYFLADPAFAEQWSHYVLYEGPLSAGGIVLDGRRKYQAYERRD